MCTKILIERLFWDFPRFFPWILGLLQLFLCVLKLSLRLTHLESVSRKFRHHSLLFAILKKSIFHSVTNFCCTLYSHCNFYLPKLHFLCILFTKELWDYCINQREYVIVQLCKCICMCVSIVRTLHIFVHVFSRRSLRNRL